MNLNIWGDFHIYISVPLKWHIRFPYYTKKSASEGFNQKIKSAAENLSKEDTSISH